ncbi:MAG: polysaccharide biosynthesis protein, partial [Lysobacterales bacterium]
MTSRMRRSMAAVHPRFAVVLHDLAMVGFAWFIATWLPWNLRPEPIVVLPVSINALLVVLVQGGVLWWTGLYRGLWRFASLPDLWNIARAAIIGTLAITLVLFLYTRLEHVPR